MLHTIRKWALNSLMCVTALFGGVLLFAGCWTWYGMEKIEWELWQEGYPLKIPQSFFTIGENGIGGHWVDQECERPRVEVDNWAFHWIDNTNNKGGISYRLRSIVINSIIVIGMGVIFLAYPISIFVKGPYRRFCYRRIGCCSQCGYNLTGNVSGVCPECGTPIDKDRLGKASKKLNLLHDRWLKIGVFGGIVFLAVIPPRAEFGHVLPAAMKHPLLVFLSFVLALIGCQRTWLVGRDLAWFFFLFVIAHLVYYFICYPAY